MKTLLQISAGRGPAECCWVVAQVLKCLLDEARQNGLKAKVLSREKGEENGTLLSATAAISGQAADSFCRNWNGTIQWIGQSQFRKHHRRKNWFVGVTVLASHEKREVRDSEIRYETFRSGGPGGQHVNKVNSAVRAIHKPSGLAAVCSDGRSQHQNKKQAKERLMQLILLREREQQREANRSNWQNHHELQRGNPIRVFKGTDFKTDRSVANYKSKRQKLKHDLKNRNWQNED